MFQPIGWFVEQWGKFPEGDINLEVFNMATAYHLT